jgi:beta-lactamase regulating signal transducer with metallopeptidase domain
MSDQTHLLAVLFDAAFKGAILLSATMLLSLLLRRAAAATRHLIWSLALIGVLALPFLSFIIPQWNVPLVPQILPSSESLQRLPGPELRLPKSKSQKIYQAESNGDKTWTVSTNYAAPVSTPQQESNWRGVLPAWSWSMWIFVIWLGGVFIVAARWLLGWMSVKFLSRRAEEILDDEWYDLSENLSAELGLKQPVKLLRAENAMAPMTWGLFRPAILLPHDAGTWSAERRRVVLLHELAHIKRGDLLSQLIAQLACALYWFNPLAWIAARQLRMEREQACDDAVLNSGAKASDYANHILEILRALRFAKYSPSAAVAMAQCSQIESRLRAILNPNLRRRTLTPTGELCLGAAVACIVLPLAALSPWTRLEKKSIDKFAVSKGQFQFNQPQFSFGLSSKNAINDPMVISPWPDKTNETATPSASTEDCDEEKQDSGVGLRLDRLVQDGANLVGENLVSAMRALGIENLRGESLVGETAEKLGNVLAKKLRASGYEEWKIDDIIGGIGSGVDDEYVQDVKKSGYPNISIEQLLQMRIHGVDAEYIREMKAAGFENLSIDELIQMRIHGVDGEYAKEMKAAFGNLSLDELLQLRIQGVDADYAKEMKAAGFGDLGIHDLLQLRIQGVDAEYAKEMKAAGYADLSIDQLLQTRIQGVDADYAKEMKATYGDLSINELLQLRIQGVDADYAKEMKAAGYADLSIEQLLQTRIQGVDADYAKEMKATFGDLSINELLQLRIQGVDAEYAKEMKAAGFGDLSTDEILQLRIQGVDADYAKEMKTAGFADLSTGELLQLRIQGVDADYVKEMKVAGFDKLTSDQLLQMRIQGVDADFVKELKEAGLKNLSPEKAIQMRIHGFDAKFFKE